MKIQLLAIILVTACTDTTEKVMTLAPRSFVKLPSALISPVSLEMGNLFVKASVFVGCQVDLHYGVCIWEHDITEFMDFPRAVCTGQDIACDHRQKQPIPTTVNLLNRVQTDSNAFELVILSAKPENVLVTGARVIVK